MGLAFALLESPAGATWVAAWYAAPFPATPVLAPQDVRDYADASVTQTLVLTGGGRRIRVAMTNALGPKPLRFEVASVSVDGRSLPLRFSGEAGATLPPGASLLSDPLPLAVRPFQTLAITVRYGKEAVPAAHLLTVRVTKPDGSERSGRGPALASEIDVDREGPPRVVVALGDSITEGFGASQGSHSGWPERLARRIAGRGWTVVDSGINGNRLLRDGAGPNALARLDRDVLAIPGVRTLILLEGINDLGWGNAKPATDGPLTAADLIAADRQIIARAHAHGIRVIGGTVLPYRGSLYYTARGDAERHALNQWIRTGRAFDGVIDFARSMADPADPDRLSPALANDDHLHPNDAGYAKMATAIDYHLLEGAVR